VNSLFPLGCQGSGVRGQDKRVKMKIRFIGFKPIYLKAIHQTRVETEFGENALVAPHALRPGLSAFLSHCAS
jgi:hypothetical protein